MEPMQKKEQISVDVYYSGEELYRRMSDGRFFDLIFLVKPVREEDVTSVVKKQWIYLLSTGRSLSIVHGTHSTASPMMRYSILKAQAGKSASDQSLIFVAFLFLFHVDNMEKVMFWAFIIGNLSYCAVRIWLAVLFEDNRAFCKYICPITVFLKPMSYFSLLRIKCNADKGVSCGKCRRVCPMDVDVTDNSRRRENGTEGILCFECVKVCPKKAL